MTRPTFLDVDPFEVVWLSCEVTVDGERLAVEQHVAAAAWDDPEARKHIERSMRYKIMERVLEKAPPKIEVRR